MVLPHGGQITSIKGVWDLPMIAGEAGAIKYKYQLLTEGPEVELHNAEGTFVNSPDGTWGQLVEHFSEEYLSKKKLTLPYNHPDNTTQPPSLPSDFVFVVRTSALQKLEELTPEPEPGAERPVGRRERTTLFVIVAALAKLARIEVTKPSSAAATIESQTALMGTRVAARTIENHLNRIPEALESRQKTDAFRNCVDRHRNCANQTARRHFVQVATRPFKELRDMAITPARLDPLPAIGYVRQSQLIPAIFPFSSATLWRKVKDGTFPKPVKLGPRITAWRVDDIRADHSQLW